MTRSCHNVTVVSICCLLLSGCGRQKYVAYMSGKGISADEFRDRYKAYVQSQASTRDNILLREQILNNMINERLIYQDAHTQMFDGDQDYAQRMTEIREQALLDRYAKSVSSDTVGVSEQELWKETSCIQQQSRRAICLRQDRARGLEAEGAIRSGSEI